MAGSRRKGGGGLDAASLEAAALRYLERYASSAANLRRVLMRRVRRTEDAAEAEAAAARIEPLVEKLERLGLLDDARYAEAKAASLHRAGASRRHIEGRLAQQGVDGEHIADALAEIAATTPDPELAAAATLARRRRLGPYRTAPRREGEEHRELGIFARAGFPLDIARRILACRTVEALEAMLRAAG